jgi:hypothetical protein
MICVATPSSSIDFHRRSAFSFRFEKYASHVTGSNKHAEQLALLSYG